MFTTRTLVQRDYIDIHRLFRGRKTWLTDLGMRQQPGTQALHDFWLNPKFPNLVCKGAFDGDKLISYFAYRWADDIPSVYTSIIFSAEQGPFGKMPASVIQLVAELIEELKERKYRAIVSLVTPRLADIYDRTMGDLFKDFETRELYRVPANTLSPDPAVNSIFFANTTVPFDTIVRARVLRKSSDYKPSGS